MKGLGRQVQVGFAKEASRGTAEASPTYFVPFSEAAIEEKIDQVINEQSYGILEDAIDDEISGKHSEITLKGAVGSQTFPLLLLSALGSVSSAANADASGSVYDHTFSVQQSVQHQSLTVFLNDPLAGQDYAHPLGSLDTLELDYQQGAFVEASIKMLSKKGETAAITPATTTESLFLPQHFSLKLASSLSGLDAASAMVVKGFKLTINKNLEADNALGSVDPVDFLNKQIVIEGEIDAVWDSEADYKTSYLAGTKQAMRVDLTNSDVVIGTAAHPELKIDLAKVSFSELTRPFKVGDVVMQTVKFKALYSVSDTEMATITATNLVTSY